MFLGAQNGTVTNRNRDNQYNYDIYLCSRTLQDTWHVWAWSITNAPIDFLLYPCLTRYIQMLHAFSISSLQNTGMIDETPTGATTFDIHDIDGPLDFPKLRKNSPEKFYHKKTSAP